MEVTSKIFFAIGAAIPVIGLVLQWYPNSVIGGIQQTLSQGGLSADETNKLQGSLDSWKVWQITTFQPLSSILIAVGIIILVYSIIASVFSLASSYKVVKKTEKE
jgi:hypothetical protein